LMKTTLRLWRLLQLIALMNKKKDAAPDVTK
jgi:hypothetical protein